MTIECLDDDVDDPGPRLRRRRSSPRASTPPRTGIEHSVEYWNRYLDDHRAGGVDNEFAPPMSVAKGLEVARYAFCFWNLADDEYLLVESDVPPARYWSFHCYDMGRYHLVDPLDRQSSLDHDAGRGRRRRSHPARVLGHRTRAWPTGSTRAGGRVGLADAPVVLVRGRPDDRRPGWWRATSSTRCLPAGTVAGRRDRRAAPGRPPGGPTSAGGSGRERRRRPGPTGVGRRGEPGRRLADARRRRGAVLGRPARGGGRLAARARCPRRSPSASAPRRWRALEVLLPALEDEARLTRPRALDHPPLPRAPGRAATRARRLLRTGPRRRSTRRSTSRGWSAGAPRTGTTALHALLGPGPAPPRARGLGAAAAGPAARPADPRHRRAHRARRRRAAHAPGGGVGPRRDPRVLGSHAEGVPLGDVARVPIRGVRGPLRRADATARGSSVRHDPGLRDAPAGPPGAPAALAAAAVGAEVAGAPPEPRRCCSRCTPTRGCRSPTATRSWSSHRSRASSRRCGRRTATRSTSPASPGTTRISTARSLDGSSTSPTRGVLDPRRVSHTTFADFLADPARRRRSPIYDALRLGPARARPGTRWRRTATPIRRGAWAGTSTRSPALGSRPGRGAGPLRPLRGALRRARWGRCRDGAARARRVGRSGRRRCSASCSATGCLRRRASAPARWSSPAAARDLLDAVVGTDVDDVTRSRRRRRAARSPRPSCGHGAARPGHRPGARPRRPSGQPHPGRVRSAQPAGARAALRAVPAAARSPTPRSGPVEVVGRCTLDAVLRWRPGTGPRRGRGRRCSTKRSGGPTTRPGSAA